MLVGKLVRSCAAAVGVLIAACAFHAGSKADAADLYGAPGPCGYGGCGYKDEGLYIPPPLLWGGFYIGGFAGVAWSQVDTSGNVIIVTGSGAVPFGTIDTSGVFGGGQLGYNFEWGRFVYGIEADLGGMDTGTTVDFSNRGLGGILQIHSSGGFVGDITTRGGYLFGNALVYAKGGWAFFTGDVRISDPSSTVNLDSSWFSGWTVGAGVEYLVAPNWSLKAEYQYYDFSDSSNVGGTITSNTFKIGFNWFPRTIPAPLY
jgi:outer membrane immunogenic protein